MSKLRGEGVCSRQNFTVDIDAWCVCVSRRLQLNSGQPDLAWFGKPATLGRL